jgi:CheY-like chemotaxis protein
MSNAKDWNILVVEDEPDGQIVVARLLRYFNVSTDAVGTAEDAISALSEKNYTAAVIDLALPGMDGLQLIQNIRQNPDTSNLPCIAITAYHTSSVRQQAIDAGFDTYFSKPLDDTSFFREVSRVIDER